MNAFARRAAEVVARFCQPSALGAGFLLVWTGQAVSMFTMAMMRFALAVWAYQHSDSIIEYSIVVVCISLPGLLVSPWAGSLVDRHSRRHVILVVDCIFVSASLALALLAIIGQLTFWHVYIAGAVTSVCQAFRLPAYLAATTTMVPKAQLGRASGMTHLAGALAQIAGPAASAPLLASLGLSWVAALNAAGFAVSAAILYGVRFPYHEASANGAAGLPGGGISHLIEAIVYLRSRPGLSLLLGYCALQSFVLMTVLVLFTPMVLTRHSQIELGQIMSAGGIGALIGSLLVIARGAPRHLVATMLWVDVLFSVAIGSAGAVTSAALLGMALFVAMFCGPVLQTSAQTLWQRKIPLGMQGRVFALETAVTTGTMPLAALLGGLLAERVFEPGFMPGGTLAAWFGALTGTGKGVGIQFMFVVAAAASAIIGAVGFASEKFRRLDQELPDVQ